jgi:hypothetical protein
MPDHPQAVVSVESFKLSENRSSKIKNWVKIDKIVYLTKVGLGAQGDP